MGNSILANTKQVHLRVTKFNCISISNASFKLIKAIERLVTTTKKPTQTKLYPKHSAFQALLHLHMYGQFTLKTDANGTRGLGYFNIKVSALQTDHWSIVTDTISTYSDVFHYTTFF